MINRLLNEVNTRLTKTTKGKKGDPKSNKRGRWDSEGASANSAADRSGYPPEAKPIYLRLKNDQRRKIIIANQISNMHSHLLKRVYPSSVQFKFNINNNRSDKVKKQWNFLLNDCKSRMTKVLLDELFEKYSLIKDTINTDYDELSKILDNQQIIEIKDFLKKRDQGMAPILVQRNKHQYEPPTKPERKTIAPKHRKLIPKPQQERGMTRIKWRSLSHS